jgi:prefoldin subunit 5
MLEYAVNSLSKHEKELDSTTRRLEKVREELLSNIRNTNASIDNVIQKIEVLDNEIQKLKSI